MENLVVVFPGQGSQYVGMGKELNDGFSTARRVFEEAEEALGYDLRELMFAGDLEQLTRTEYAQPALLAVSVAAFRVYMEQVGVTPAYGAGHSLGEFSALCCAGAIAFADAVRIVSLRGRFMQEAAAEGTGAMCAVLGASGESVAAACQAASGGGQIVVISNYNSPGQIVISGHREVVDAAARTLAAQGARTVALTVSAPFHSPLMAPAAGKLEQELRRLTYGKLQWPVVSNVTARPYADSAEVVGLLTQQLTSPVRWDASMHFVQQAGARVAVELGPQQVLTNLMRANARDIVCYPLEKPGQLAAIIKALGGTAAAAGDLPVFAETLVTGSDRQVAKEELAVREVKAVAGAAGQGEPTDAEARLNHVVTRCLAAAVCTRNRNEDEAEYRAGVIEPYRRIQAIQEQLDESGHAPDEAQMREALELLKRIMDTKRVALKEQRERFKEILEKTGTYSMFSSFYADGLFATSGGERVGLSIH
ncbi:ACP S-malonyltransferase [Paenibacillus athensensis]|uniref:[acyl-carrier-protein] S-malonyltransferase n=1 Tax=Paenibacillus athensensis TaxID=1967502 RepID=A0A4Y8PWA0_9BACL|nr:ACP S-malonyltransferase [Paenibacillus athensensis]MCD1260590.1 ACP S-malonyltransferase [Paenibacillus athensensis]